MKEKKKDGEGGGRPRGSRKNIVGSESQGLLQAAAGSGFIGFSAFQAPAKVSADAVGIPEGAAGGTAGSAIARGKALARGGDGGKRRVKMAKAGGGGYSARSPGQVLPPHYSGSDSQLAVVSKRLSKRDVTTKLKALAELRSMCRAVTGDKTQPGATPQPSAGPATTAEDLGGLAPHWVFLYQRLSAEGDRRTREAANATLLCMLRANRRAFQPLMRALMGPWWCSQADTAAEVATSAREAFDAIFPGVKRALVLQRCAGGVLSHIDAALQQTPETLEETSGCTVEEAEKRADRLSVSALAALSNFLEAVGEEANSALCRPADVDSATADRENAGDAGQGRQESATYLSVVNEALWARLDDPRPLVRRAMYVLVSSCCRHAPGLLRPSPPPCPAAAQAGSPSLPAETEKVVVDETEAKPGADNKEKGRRRNGGGISYRKRSRVAVPILLAGLLSEKEDSNHREAWEAVLLVLREFKQNWMEEKGATAVLPTLLTRLRKNAFLPTSSTSYPSLLPFLASLPEQALLAPADQRTGGARAPFCAALLESLWATTTSTVAGNSDGGGGGMPGWVDDVVSAHVECATFLLLKLPPPSEGGSPDGNSGREHDAEAVAAAAAAAAAADSADGASGEVDREQNSVAVGVSAALAHLAKAVRSLVCDEEAEAAESGLGAGGAKSAWRESAVIKEAFSSALGQLHLGAEKGSGVMGSLSGSAGVWGALLREFKGALDERSSASALWMGNTLTRALANVNERHHGREAGKTAPTIAHTFDATVPPSRKEEGLRGVCRALFHHCVRLIGHVNPGETGEDGGNARAISTRDAPLTVFMSSMAGALGLGGIYHMQDAPVPSDQSGSENSIGPDIQGILSRDEATEFFENFLVPRLVASASCRGPKAVGVVALKTIVEGFLHAEEGSGHAGYDFRLLLERALAEPAPVRLRTTTMVLRLAPQGTAGNFPEVDQEVLMACGRSSPGVEAASSPPSTSPALDCAAQDVPAFLQACLGVTSGRRTTAPFMNASTVSETVRTAMPSRTAAGEPVGNPTLSMAVQEGLLGVLAAGQSTALAGEGSGSSGGEDEGEDALAAVRKEGLPLLLEAFSGHGEAPAAERLWRQCGAPVLEELVARGAASGEVTAGKTPPESTGCGVWRDFLDGAVEETRRAMEGGEEEEALDHRAPLPGHGGAERAATLATALVELQQRLLRRGAAQRVEAPVLWRLGLTRPSVWRQRRLEAFSRAGAGAGSDELAPAAAAPAVAGASAAEFGRACIESRWARRWECFSLMLDRLPDARSRLSFLVEGVGSADVAAGSEEEVAGEALHEIITAGVVANRAEMILNGDVYARTEAGGAAAAAAAAAGDDNFLVDLPSRLLFSSAVSTPGTTGGVPRGAASSAGSTGAARGGVDPAEEFGIGLPGFPGSLPKAGGGPAAAAAAAAAVASAGVLDAARAHLSDHTSDSKRAVGPKAGAVDASTIGGHAQLLQQQRRWSHPFDLLLPEGLWRATFESAAESTIPTAEDARRLHGVLLSALRFGADLAAEDAAATLRYQGGGGEIGAWRVSCSAEISIALLVSVVGEAFARGLGLGDDANRLMAVRCGIAKGPALSEADLLPGAKTLYTRDGLAVTIIAAHVDPGGGESYFTVRPVSAPGSTDTDSAGRERQTVLDRLSLSPPAGGSSSAITRGVAGVPPPGSPPWLVRPSIAAKLGDVLSGPLLAIEQSLWENLARSSTTTGPAGPALSSATAAAFRGLASTCVRATLLSGPGPNADESDAARAWEAVRPVLLALRKRWASAAVKSGSVALAARAGAGGSLQAAATVALATSVLSGFLSATPFMPSDDEAMQLLPARLRSALCDEAEGKTSTAAASAAAADGDASSGVSLGWRRAQAMAGLAWLRDCAEASCKVHAPLSPGSLGSGIFADTQAETEAAVVALVASPTAGRPEGVMQAGGSMDLALAKACAGLFAGEASLLVLSGEGYEASLSCESKATVVSWAVSKFLLSGGRMATAASGGVPPDKAGNKADAALCLETARLLTATAWDGRQGWGAGGGSAGAGGGSPYRRLVAGREDRAKVWEAARSPPVWRGLHAAVVGAVRSPVLQLCAFEVLEAAAADWQPHGAAAAATYPGGETDDVADGAAGNSGAQGEGDGDEESKGEGEEAVAAAGAGGSQSVVSRLARALGGWGLASTKGEAGQGQGGESVGVGFDGGIAGGGGGAGEETLSPGSEAVEEEAKEQQDDLELIARCFPEDLLLAVEALPYTIDALAEVPQESGDGAREEDELEEDEEDEEDEREEDDDEGAGDEEVEEESEEAEGVAGAEDNASSLNEGVGSVGGRSDTSESASETSIDAESESGGGEDGHGNGSIRTPKAVGASKSRRMRLQRRRSGGTSSLRLATRGPSGHIPGRGRGRLSPASGSSLTAPFLTWLLWLEHCRRASELETNARSAARAFVSRAGALAPVLEACFRVLRASQDGAGRGGSASSRLSTAQAVRVSRLDPRNPHDLAHLALSVFFRTVHVFPALTRSWWADDCARGQRVWVAEFTKRHVSPALIQIEAQVITDATDKGLWDQDGGEMSVRASANSRQVVASYLKDECTLEAVIQLPPDYPLRNVEVTCSKRMGVSEGRWRQWVLQIVTLLSLQDGSVLDAVMMWKKNVDKEFEGVEPCVICYSVLHPKTMDLPQMTCKTCKNRFHSSCLYKWFHTSHKNKCPICQQTWA